MLGIAFRAAKASPLDFSDLKEREVNISFPP